MRPTCALALWALAWSRGGAADGVKQGPFFSKAAAGHLEKTYWPALSKLFIREGDKRYPMPPRDKVVDLLQGLADTPGLAVHTSPDVTVSEGQGYAMLAAGMRKDVEALKGLTVGWQASGQGFSDTPPCGGCGVSTEGPFSPKDVCTGKVPTTCLCKTVKGAYMPGWDMPFTMLGSLGSATDGDGDAVTGLIYLAELTNSSEFREYAVRSITAFILEDIGYANASANSRFVPVMGDIPEALQVMYLWRGGSCWGGYDTSATTMPDDRNLCINPAYFSPGEWRLFKEYLARHSSLVPAPYTAEELGAVLESAIVWGYNTLRRISCDSGLVSNWWTLPDKGWPYEGELKCVNSGTAAGAYGADAGRIPWRVVLDFLWFGERATAPSFDEHGKRQGLWGAKEYANRWASSWRQMIMDAAEEGTYPPTRADATPLRTDQVLPLLSDLKACDMCPDGFTASAWNGWGAYPVIPTFQVLLDGTDSEVMEEWVEFLANIGFEGCQRQQYFDLGQEVIVSAMLSGRAWHPLRSTGSASSEEAVAPKPHKPKPIFQPLVQEPHLKRHRSTTRLPTTSTAKRTTATLETTTQLPTTTVTTERTTTKATTTTIEATTTKPTTAAPTTSTRTREPPPLAPPKEDMRFLEHTPEDGDEGEDDLGGEDEQVDPETEKAIEIAKAAVHAWRELQKAKTLSHTVNAEEVDSHGSIEMLSSQEPETGSGSKRIAASGLAALVIGAIVLVTPARAFRRVVRAGPLEDSASTLEADYIPIDGPTSPATTDTSP